MDFVLPDNRTVDSQFYILDPLSVIIKLAILNNKPIGTKVCIDKNNVYLQSPGIFQSLCRYTFKSNKTDLQFFYNPIEIACRIYLNESTVKNYPKIPDLFKSAQGGRDRIRSRTDRDRLRGAWRCGDSRA